MRGMQTFRDGLSALKEQAVSALRSLNLGQYFLRAVLLASVASTPLDAQNVTGFGTVLNLQNIQPDPQHPGQSLARAIWVQLTEAQRIQAGQSVGVTYVNDVLAHLGQ